MKTCLAVISACFALAACGGSNDPPFPQAKAASAPVGFFPSQPTQQHGNLWFSHSELTNGLFLTATAPYLWESVYTVTVKNVLPTDIVHCQAQAEVTNDLGYNVQVDRAIAIGNWSGSAWPVFAHPIAGENVSADMHHMYISFGMYDETPRRGDVTYSLVLSAASTAAKTGDAIRIEEGYGMLQCEVIHQ